MTTGTSTEHEMHDALDRLSRVHGEGGLRAAVLALVMGEDDADGAVDQAWRRETEDVPAAAHVRADAECLDERRRLPAVEALLDRVRILPKAQRRPLLRSYRRVMAARGAVRPIDRLQWLQMRRRLGDRPPVAFMPAAHNEMTRLPESLRLQVAAVTAYLARIVPDGDAVNGEAWREAVLGRFMPQDDDIDRTPPDADALAHALEGVETLPWMLRPVLMRAWVDCALALSFRARLPRPAADAFRLVAVLLDSPLPPALARCYTEIEWTTQADTA